jgi:hypothetical protein
VACRMHAPAHCASHSVWDWTLTGAGIAGQTCASEGPRGSRTVFYLYDLTFQNKL